MGMESHQKDHRIVVIDGETFEYIPGLGLVLMD